MVCFEDIIFCCYAYKGVIQYGHIKKAARKLQRRQIYEYGIRFFKGILKQKMLEECPVLRKHFSTAESEHYLLFQVDVLNTEFTGGFSQ